MGAEEEDDEEADDRGSRAGRPERLLRAGPAEREGAAERRQEAGEEEGEDRRPREARLREDPEVEGRRVIRERNLRPEEIVRGVRETRPERPEAAAGDRVLPREGEGSLVEEKPLRLAERRRLLLSERVREAREEGASAAAPGGPREGGAERERDEDRERSRREGHAAPHARLLPGESVRRGPEDEDEDRDESADEAAPRAGVREEDEEPGSADPRGHATRPAARDDEREARGEEERGADSGGGRVGEGGLRAPPGLPLRRAKVREEPDLLKERRPSCRDRGDDQGRVREARSAPIPSGPHAERVEAGGEEEGGEHRDAPGHGLLRVQPESVDDPRRRDVPDEEIGRAREDDRGEDRDGRDRREGAPERRQAVAGRRTLEVVDRAKGGSGEVGRERDRRDDGRIGEAEREGGDARHRHREPRDRERPERSEDGRREEENRRAPDRRPQGREWRQENDRAEDRQDDPAEEREDPGDGARAVHEGGSVAGRTGGRAS